ncbi:MAG: hypothetical protein R6V04_13360 [bacterium]
MVKSDNNTIADRIDTWFLNHQKVVFLLLILLFTIIEIRIINEIHIIHYNFERLVLVGEGALRGMPSYRAFQNRLLGSILVKAISIITGLSFRAASKFFIYATLFLSNFLCFFLFSDLTRSKKSALKYTFYFIVIFIAMQHYKYIILFDFPELIIALLFAYGVFKNKGLGYFLPVFLIGIVNKESSLFICLWLIINEVLLIPGFPFIQIKHKLPFAAGWLLAGIGIAYTKLSRDLLFKKSIIEEVGQDSAHKVYGNHIRLMDNLKELFYHNITSTNIIVTVFLLTLIGFIIYLNLKYKEKFIIRLSILMLIMITSNVVFGVVNETRIYFYLIPFILMLVNYYNKNL